MMWSIKNFVIVGLFFNTLNIEIGLSWNHLSKDVAEGFGNLAPTINLEARGEGNCTT